MRSIVSPEGIGDRLRSVAMAEMQARDAFLDAAERFESEAPVALTRAWRALAHAENKHLSWLIERLEDLGQGVGERRVCDQLYRTLSACDSPEDFARYMALAETRGMQAGDKFRVRMAEVDPETARLFGAVADEEADHIRLAHRFFPQLSGSPSGGLSARAPGRVLRAVAADVDLGRSVDPVVGQLLLPVGEPAGDPRHGEQAGERVGGDAQPLVDDA